jgi:predicted nicotinamide N-methyase
MKAETESPQNERSGGVDEVLKLCFFRSISAEVPCGSKRRVTIALFTEFRESISAYINMCEISAVVSCDSQKNYACALVHRGDSKCVFEFSAPTTPCTFRLKFSAVHDSVSILVVPLISDLIQAICQESCARSAVTFAEYHPYRVDGCPQEIVIFEEFGSTLGSHVWDSAVVITKNLPKILKACEVPVEAVVLELGAGCSLVGIAMTVLRAARRVFVTDLSAQLPFMQRNIEINRCEGVVVASVLDWSNTEQTLSLMESISEDIDLIVAADVLYDLAAAEALFHVLRKASSPNKTCILIGQKIRSNRHSAVFDVRVVPGFSAVEIMREANVIVWKLMLV